MFKQFKELVGKGDNEGLKKLIEKSDPTELCDLILPRITKNDSVKILNHILSNFSTTEQCQSKRRKLIEAVLQTIKKSKITSVQANDLVTRIVNDFPKYSKLHLVKLVDNCLNSLRINDDDFNCWKDILPIILQILEDEKYINYKGTEVAGSEYKSLIIKSICNQPWENAILTSLATMFGEIRMEKADHGVVIRALCDQIPEVELNELPPLVHQLLRLSSNADGRLVIETLQKYFSKLYTEALENSADSMEVIGQISLKEIQETESTVLYHIHQSALLNHSSLTDFVKNLKNITHAPEFILNPFPIAVLLLVSDIYEDQVFDIIKQALSRKIQDDEKQKSHAWLREVLPEKWKVMDTMDQIIINSNKDRHLVLKGLVDLAFVLLESGKIKNNEENHMHEIGIRIIQRLIKKRPGIGPTVLEKLTDKIVTGGTAIIQYTDCLTYMCRKATIVVLDSQVWILTLLEQLLSIPGEAATQVLHATLPLIRISPCIRDKLILILRKALYRKGVCMRKMAVSGFLQFLSNLKIAPFSLSQSGSSMNTTSSGSIFTQATMERGSQNPRTNPRCNSAFCKEILGILAKCFSHEFEVRQHLYKGLYDALCHNPELAEPIIEILLNHFNDFYEIDEDIKPPIKFHDCSNATGPEAILEEPIGDLVFVLQKIYCKMAMKNLSILDNLSMVLESLCKRITQTELEHLNIDEGTDLLDNIPKSQQKVNSLKLISTVLEALISFRIGSWCKENQTAANSVSQLFKSYTVIVEFSKRVVKSKKGDGKNKKDKDQDTTIRKISRTTSLKLPPSIIDLETVKKMLTVLYDPSVSFATREQTVVLKKRPEFHKYVLNTCIHVFQDAKLLKNIERKRHRDTFIKDYFIVGELIYKHIVSNLNEIREFEEDIAILGLECFKELIDLMYTVFENDLPKFFATIIGADTSGGLALQVSEIINSFQQLINNYYEEEIEEDDQAKKIPQVLFEIISSLIQKCIPDDGNYSGVFKWLLSMAKSEKVDDNIAIIILQLIATIEDRNAEYGKVVDEMCIELCKKLGTIDGSATDVEEVNAILGEFTLLQAHSIFSNSMKNKLANAQWVYGRLKAEQIIAMSPGIGDELHREKLKEKERILCKQLCYVVRTLQTLTNASMEPGSNTDATFKNLYNLYSLLNHLTKYFSSKSSPQNPAFESVRFIQVVQLAGKPLKSTFYNLITHTEENQNRTRKSDAQAQRNKVLKETRFIPKVIYELEQFNQGILSLGKKTGVPLDNYIKHSITRDFRIKHPQLIEALEKLDVTQMTQPGTQRSQASNDGHLDISDASSGHNTSHETDADAPQRKKARKSR